MWGLVYNAYMPKIHTLKNNITLILDSNKNSLTTSVHIGVPVGSNNEKSNQYGLAHFFEHMCFKGTKKYPTYLSLVNKITSLGLYSNARTETEMTSYYLIGDAKHTEEMINLSAEMFINSLFPAEELEKEKGVIVEEIKMYEDNPSSKSYEILEVELFKGTEAGHLTVGSIESVKSFSRDDFLKFQKKHYVADNTIIVISGKFDDDAIVKKVSEAFKDTRRGEKTKHPILKINKTLGKQLTSISKKDLEQTSVSILFYSVGEDSDKTVIVTLLGVILGDDTNSRLWSSIREEMGLCYSIESGDNASSNYGNFYIHTGISSNNFERVIKQIAVECSKLKTELVTEEELEIAKQIFIGHILRATETVGEKARHYFEEYVKEGKIITNEDLINKINKVTASQIQHMAQEIFKGDEVKVATVGDVTFKKSSIAPLLNL